MLNSLKLPKESIYKQFIPKKQFYTHGNFNSTERNLFTQSIEKITLHAQLTRENTNIPPYSDEMRTYEEISVFIVELRKLYNIKKVARLMMEVIPYPIILIGKFNNQYNFLGANKRDNLVDDNKIILEKLYQTGFISNTEKFFDQINFVNLNKNDFFVFYNNYIQVIIEDNLARRNISQVENSEATLQRIEKLEHDITTFKSKLKVEKHFNKKMELNMIIKRLEQELKQMED